MDALEEKAFNLLSVRQASQLLSFSEGHLYELCRKREFPCIKIGGKIRIKRDDLLTILDKGLPKGTPIVPSHEEPLS
jgi:excisionase family DNA binding protein